MEEISGSLEIVICCKYSSPKVSVFCIILVCILYPLWVYVGYSLMKTDCSQKKISLKEKPSIFGCSAQTLPTQLLCPFSPREQWESSALTNTHLLHTQKHLKMPQKLFIRQIRRVRESSTFSTKPAQGSACNANCRQLNFSTRWLSDMG